MSAIVYVLVALALISGLFATVLLLVWRWIDRKPHVLAWAGAFGAATLQWLCLLQGEFVADGFAEFWVLGSACAIVTVSFALAGYRMRAGLPVRSQLLLGSGFVVLAAVLWFATVNVHAGVAAGVPPLYSSLVLGLCVHALWRRSGPVLPAEWTSMGLLGVFATLQFAAAVTAFGGGSETAAWMGRYEALHYLTLPAAYAGIGSFMIFLVATDLSEQMKGLAITDQLTGVLNRRGFLDEALRAIAQARRSGLPLTLVMTDLDHFKRINDTYGHGTGDRALRRFAVHLDSELRQGDLVGRIGGEEFALLLSHTALDDGVLAARRLCHALDIASLEVDGARVHLTASFGVAALSESDGDVEDLLDRADRGLYLAKETGRNRVCVAPEETGPDFAVA